MCGSKSSIAIIEFFSIFSHCRGDIFQLYILVKEQLRAEKCQLQAEQQFSNMVIIISLFEIVPLKKKGHFHRLL